MNIVAWRVTKYTTKLVCIGKHLESFKKLIGKKLQAKRIEMGFSQESLAGELGSEQPQVSAWERGLHIPEGKQKAKLIEVLKVDESFFETIELAPETREHVIGEIMLHLSRLDMKDLETIRMTTDALLKMAKPNSTPRSGKT